MPERLDFPFNIDVLNLTPGKLQGLRPCTSTDLMSGQTNNFHEDGLFSVLTFGRVGDEKRSLRFSYIDVKLTVFHPMIFKTLSNLKRLYEEIMSGQTYATWNAELRDFERSDPITGQTGFAFFVEHWKDINFVETDSESREQNVKLIRKYMDVAMTSKIVVLPAGIRDLEETSDGRYQMDEINEHYRKLISISNTITEADVKNSSNTINNTRYRIQVIFNELYTDIENRISGKKKLLQGKWASRRVMNGTRNVITAMDPSCDILGDKSSISFNDTVVGLYQAMKSILPISVYHLRNGFLVKVFTNPDTPVRLVNKKTLKRQDVMLKPMYFDRWTTNEGLEKVISAFSEEVVRHKPIEINDCYLGLIYKGPDGTFKIIQDIDEVPEARNKGDVSPLTFAELLYLSVYREINNYPAFVTRYPITGLGSIYPSKMYVKTTTKVEKRRELNEMWEPMDDSYIAYQFPIRNAPFVTSMMPHSSKLARLGADFDGDTCSLTSVYTDESVKEVNNYLDTKKAYVGPDGRFINSVGTDTVNLVFLNFSS